MYIQTMDIMTDYDKRQTRPLVREGPPPPTDITVTFTTHLISGHEPKRGLDTKTDRLTDREP
jgi:hypothetical protein